MTHSEPTSRYAARTLRKSPGFAGVVVLTLGVAIGANSTIFSIGVRMALGARARDVLAMVASEGLRPVAVGAGLGILAGLGFARLMASRFYGVGATDPAVFLGVPALLAVVGLLAVLLPARRAARVDPMTTLRSE